MDVVKDQINLATELNKMVFKKSPILVKRDNGETSKIIELDLIPFENFNVLEIESVGSGRIIGVYEFDGRGVSPIIEVDRSYFHINLIYKLKHNTNFGVDEKVVYRHDNVSLLTDGNDDIPDADLTRYEEVLQLVREEMEQPKGTEAEKADHTRKLKDSITKPDARDYVFKKIENIVTSAKKVRDDEIPTYINKIYAQLYGLGVLQELDDDPEVGEIMVNAVDFPYFHADIYYVKNQKKYLYDKTFKSLNELKGVFNKVIAFSGKEMNANTNAMIEANRPNRDRVTLIIPYASDNYSLNIRKFSNFVPDKDTMRKSGTVNETLEEMFKILVKGKANIGIGGPMGTGKTTLINYLLTFTPKIERKVVIASVSETDVDRVLKGHDVLIFNVNEEKGFTFSKDVRVSLRTTAARVIIPESRGGEFKDLYEANLKTKGNMFTGHAIDDEAFLDMCVDMYMSSPEAGNEAASIIKDKICKAIDIIIMMRHVGEDKIRIKSISEVCTDARGHYDHMNRLFKWEFDPENPTEGEYAATGNPLSKALMERLNEFGVKQAEMNALNKLLLEDHEQFMKRKEEEIGSEIYG